MGNSRVVKVSSSGKVVKADKILCAFSLSGADENGISTFSSLNGENGDYYAVELRMADLVVQQAGLHPSYAHVVMPMVNFGTGHWIEKAFNWYVGAGLSGKIRSIKCRMRASVYIQTGSNKTVPLINGSVVQINHDIKKGSVLVTVFCDKFLLSKVTVFGQAQYDPVSKIFGYVTNPTFPCVFNQFGWPNCIDKATGGGSMPVFAPTLRYGWIAMNNGIENGSESGQAGGEPPPGGAKTRARSWRVVDAVQYLRMMHYSGDNTSIPGILPQGIKVTSGLTWPSKIEQILMGAGGGSDRTLHDCDCEGLTLDAALTKLAHRAGPYELYMQPGKAAGGGGDNGNDVGAGVVGDAAFGAFGTALDTAVKSLNTAFTSDTGNFEVFGPQVISFGNAFQTAFASFQSQLKGPYANAAANAIQEQITQLNNYCNGVVGAFSTGGLAPFTQAQFKQAVAAQYENLIAQIGKALNGNPGNWTLPNGAISGGGSPTATNGTGGNNPGLVAKQVGSTFQAQANNAGAAQNGNAATPSGTDSTLSFVDLRGTNGQDGPVIPALYGQNLDQAMSQIENSMSAGFWSESIINYWDAAEIFGDAPAYESTFSMSSYDPNGQWLEAAWSTLDETAFNLYWASGSVSPQTDQAFKEACLIWPLVYAAYRVKANYMKLFSGTKWSGYFACRQHPRIRPTLLTGYNAASDPNDNPMNWIPRPIIIETYSKPDDASAATPANWTPASQQDNLQLAQDGSYFMVTALRDQGGVTYTTATDPTKGFQSIPIRATLAIELDFRVSSFYMKNADKDVENQVTARTVKPKHTDQWVYTAIGKEGDYIDWNRWKSNPLGQIIPEASRMFPDKAASGDGGNLFSDTPTVTTGRLASHSQSRASDVRRVAGGGQFIFPRFALAYPPGSGIKEIKDTGVEFRGCVSTHTYKANSDEASSVETSVPSPSDLAGGTQ